MAKPLFTDINQVIERTQQTPGLILYFYNDHCPPCQILRPKIEELVEQQFPKMELWYVDSENHPEIPAHFNIFAHPTILIYFDGKEFLRESKYVSVPELGQQMNRYYQLIFTDERQ